MEASGKSLPEAKEIVLDLLGVAEDDAEFVVLSEPKPGLFGRLRGRGPSPGPSPSGCSPTETWATAQVGQAAGRRRAVA